MYIEIKENSNRDLKRINIILEFFFKRTFYFAPSLGHFFWYGASTIHTF